MLNKKIIQKNEYFIENINGTYVFMENIMEKFQCMIICGKTSWKLKIFGRKTSGTFHKIKILFYSIQNSK